MGRRDIQSIQDKPIMHCPQYKVGMGRILNLQDICLMLDRIAVGLARYPFHLIQTNHELFTIQSSDGSDIEFAGYLV